MLHLIPAQYNSSTKSYHSQTLNTLLSTWK